MLKIVADNAIPFVERFFSCIGELELVNGREISADSIKNADVLVCRTITRVDKKLLENTSLRVVASPSSGIDHIDQDYLKRQSISLAYAPGCNARSVAEYVLSALSLLADKDGFDLTDKRAGIAGCGNVGSEVRHLLEATGVECLLYDPFLQRADAGTYCELGDIQQCDIITLHVPLTRDGPYPTRQMVDETFFSALGDRVILVNTSRGDVVDEMALKSFLEVNRHSQLVIDVWSDEPAIDMALLKQAAIATPHIAGYSMDGKYRATRSVFHQVCHMLGLKNEFSQLDTIFPPDDGREIRLSDDQSDIEAVSMAVMASYDVRTDAAALRRILEDNIPDRDSYFDDLRNNYPIRREFSSLGVAVPKEAVSLRQKLLRLGFRLS